MQFEIVQGTSRTITSGNYVNFPSLTQTQIDALTGMALNSVVFNTTISRLQIYNGSSWESFTIGAVTTPAIASISTNTTLAYGVIYQVDASAGNLTLTLPTAIGNASKQISITKIDSTTNSIEIITTLSQTINGAASQTMLFTNSFFTFISNGTNWIIS